MQNAVNFWPGWTCLFAYGMEHLDSNLIRSHVQNCHVNKTPKPCRIKTFEAGGRALWELWWTYPVKPHSLSTCTTFCFPVHYLPLITLFKALKIQSNNSHFLPGMIMFGGLSIVFSKCLFFFHSLLMFFWKPCTSCQASKLLLQKQSWGQLRCFPGSAVGSSIAFLNRGYHQEPFQANSHLTRTVRKH